jgi:tetratricopeptide (TPR) repeat protein
LEGKMIWRARVFSMIPLVLVLFVFFGATPAQSQTSQDLLRQYVADLQKSPNDNTLREKIIKHVQTMRQKPAIPEEAERYMARGAAAAKGAKTEKDFHDAAAEFEKASLAAPWLPAAYYNLGITQDKAGKYREAIQSLKLYLLAAPDASDAKAVKNLTYEIEYRQEKAARDASLQAAPAPKQNPFNDLLRKIDGRRYTQVAGPGVISVIDVRGGVIVRGYIDNGRYYPWTGDAGRVEIKGRETTVPIRDQPATFKVRSVSMDFIISEDGERIAARTHFSDGDVREYMHFWQR